MRTRLQCATRTLHHAVERHFNLDSGEWTVSRYRNLLESLWGLYHPLENALREIDWQDSGIDIAARSKTALIEIDLEHLRQSTSSTDECEVCPTIPALRGIAAGLGALYVLEGSTLGGQVIIKTLGPQIGISAFVGGRFFASYGKDVGRMWRSYLTILEHFAQTPKTASTIEKGAIETFGLFDRWLGARTNQPEEVMRQTNA